MANEEQLSILKQGVEVWNKWREENPSIAVDLSDADLSEVDLLGIDLQEANLHRANFRRSNLQKAQLNRARFIESDLTGANFKDAWIFETTFSIAILSEADFTDTNLGITSFGGIDLSTTTGLREVYHYFGSHLSTDTLKLSKGRIPEEFLKGCGLSDWEIEQVKLYDPDLSNEEITQIQYKMYDLRATQALQISPLFISYSHTDGKFVDKLESQLNKKGVRFWRDIHDMKAGRMETQIDSAISQNRTVLLVLSENSLSSDWVEHEVRTARLLEKDMGRDVLCPVALDDSWKDSRWPKRVMEQIREYNILDFSAWQDDVKFEGMFRKLIDGLELFYKR